MYLLILPTALPEFETKSSSWNANLFLKLFITNKLALPFKPYLLAPTPSADSTILKISGDTALKNFISASLSRAQPCLPDKY